MARLNYLELPVGEMAATKRFYGEALGWTFSDYGPTYAVAASGDIVVGFQADPAERSSAALPVVQVHDLEATLSAVEGAGGAITKPIFAFPGGRRFHFRDPDGLELAAMAVD